MTKEKAQSILSPEEAIDLIKDAIFMLQHDELTITLHYELYENIKKLQVLDYYKTKITFEE